MFGTRQLNATKVNGFTKSRLFTRHNVNTHTHTHIHTSTHNTRRKALDII